MKFFDSNDQSIFFSQQLEYVEKKIYRKKYPNNKAMKYIPVSSEAGRGAETITYNVLDGVGMMKVIGNYADDLPRADVKGKKYTSVVKSLGGSFGYNIQEIRNAEMAKTNLKAEKGLIAKRAYSQSIDHIGWKGDSDYQILGMLNQPNIPAGAVGVGASSGNTKMEDKTSEETYFDMCDIVDSINEISNGVHKANVLLMPLAQYNLITQKSMGKDYSGKTILKYFKENRPGVTVDSINEFKDVTELPSGASGTKDIMMAYELNEENLTYHIPQTFEMLPQQPKNLEIVIPTHARVGGVEYRYPLSAKIVEGI